MQKPIIIAGVLVGLGIVGSVLHKLAPKIRKWMDGNVEADDVGAFKSALETAFAVVSAIAEATPGFPLDDGIAKFLEIASKDFEAARGRPPTALEAASIKTVALEMHADPNIHGVLGTASPAADEP